MKKKKILLLFLLCLMPCLVFASSSSDTFSTGFAISMELFVSIHMTIFVLWPLSNIFGGDEPKKLLKKMFIWRAVILLVLDLIWPEVAMLDFFAVFIGAFLVVPIAAVIKKKNPYVNTKTKTITVTRTNVNNNQGKGIVLKCVQCNTEVPVSAKFCPSCGLSMTGNNIRVEETPNSGIQISMNKIAVSPSYFDSILSLKENDMIEAFLKRELTKASIDPSSKLLPSEFLKKKKLLNLIFVLLTFVYVSMIFFHFPLATYIGGLVILFICYRLTKKYDLMKYLIKEVKVRPKEKISNIVMMTKSTLVADNSKKILFGGTLVSIVLSLTIFWNPRILYEKTDGGYAVRFYTFGVTNFKTATIPSTYKGEDVVSLRGNTFSNMPYLTSVTLPDTIVEIRGQAFKNDGRLTTVNIPKNLEYLGGGAFYNCSSITSIELPDTLTYLGGEAFYGASSLRSVKLSNSLTEIRGNTFEECISLESITIPDSVTRIGGHAFYGDSNLSSVIFTENSQLEEIGSSAFRQCSRLYTITLPNSVYINERAFKESPTSIQYFNQANVSKNVVTVDNDGTTKYIDTLSYGTIGLQIENAEVKNGYLELTLYLTGGINQSINIVCDGSTYYINNNFYIITNKYEYKAVSTTFDFYYY